MKITILPNKAISVMAGESLLQAMRRERLPLTNVCNGQGSCGKCKVRLVKGASPATVSDSKHLTRQELDQNIRLACQVVPQDGMVIQVMSENENYDRKEASLHPDDFTGMQIDPGIKKVLLILKEPSLNNAHGHWGRMADELDRQGIVPSRPGIDVLQKLTRVLQQDDYTITAVLWGNLVVDVEAGDTRDALYGVALDIGTTSVAMALVDLRDGRVKKVVSAENGQIAYGADVISRIEYANESTEKRRCLQSAIRTTVNSLIDKIAEECSIDAQSIYKMTVVGNTAMQHLLLNLDVSSLAVAPFVAVCTDPLEFAARELSIRINPRGRVSILPGIGSFVGSDTLGAVLSADGVLGDGNHLLIDLGTNCELFLKVGQLMMACSTAAGPAFEGARIARGMRAKPGAIEGAKLTGQGVDIKVIGGEQAAGICGSGLIQAIAQMKEAGAINELGAINDLDDDCQLSPALRRRIRQNDRDREFVLAYGEGLAGDIALTQRDIRELQLAKGAVCAGIKTLLEIAGISLDDLDSVVLAGTFATYLDIPSVISIGLVPNLAIQKIRSVGNAAHLGALNVLLNQGEMNKAEQLVKRIKHIELGGSPVFSNYFVDSMYITPTE